MPPVSILSAPPPPSPGAQAAEPPAPGAVPKLSLAPGPAKPAAAAPPPKQGLNLKVAAEAPKGGKPPVVPGKPPKGAKIAAALRKRSALSPIAKGGIAVSVVLLAIAALYFWKIFHPPPPPVVIVRPVIPKVNPDAARALAAEKAAAAAKLAAAKAAKEKADAEAAAMPTPTPTPASMTPVAVMANTNITSDVKVNNTQVEAAPAASAAFRTFVAGAEIGGVFQGHPSKALVNGTIVREGQIIDSTLAIEFERIDAYRKVIYFRDATGAEVSKNY
jgi:hypothetical protein